MVSRSRIVGLTPGREQRPPFKWVRLAAKVHSYSQHNLDLPTVVTHTIPTIPYARPSYMSSHDSPASHAVTSPARAANYGTGLALAVIATAQLTLVLDDSIANIALPAIQRELGISAANLPWVINAYIVAFGGLLLFSGRLGDLAGRRRVLQGGMVLFTVASLLAGLAGSGHWLIAARGLQGIGAALVAPNALALITTTFKEGPPRNKAMAIYGAMSGLGIVAGLLVGGVLTDLLGWRWVFFINVPIGLFVLAGSRYLVEAELHHGKPDVAGALTSLGGVGALVYAITRSGEHGWTDAIALGALGAAALLLPLFLLIQSRSRDPLLPLRLFKNSCRAGSYAAAVLLACGPMGALYLMTLYMQDILTYSPLKTGLSWLPFGIGIIAGAGFTTKMTVRRSPRALIVAGSLISSASMFWLSMIDTTASYTTHIMPAMFGLAFGFVMGILALTLTAVRDVRAQDSGIASALLNASQQIGVALGLATVSTVAVFVTQRQLPNALGALRQGRAAADHALIAIASDALVQGYGVALAAGGVAILIAAVIAALVINEKPGPASRPQPT
jgi:EmrB/QacA subfamily drug resistance transporter